MKLMQVVLSILSTGAIATNWHLICLETHVWANELKRFVCVCAVCGRALNEVIVFTKAMGN